MVTPHSALSDFQGNPEPYLDRLAKTGEPAVLTVNGRARLVVQDAEAYGRLLDALDYAQAVAGIQRGLDSMKRGEGRPAEEVFAEFREQVRLARAADAAE